jgi:acyl carrier protein
MAVTMEKIVNLVAVQLGTRGVKPDDRLFEELGAQSADVVNLISTLEEQYDIEIDEEEIAQIKTVADLFTVVQRLT